MNKNLTMLMIALAWIFYSLDSASDSLKERRKNIESGIRIFQELDRWKVISSESREQGKLIQSQLDKIFLENPPKDQTKLLPYLEQDSRNLLLQSATEMEKWVGGLIESLQKEWPKEEEIKEWKNLEKKEKLHKYMQLAKQERNTGQEYIRMRNPILAILALKRSTIYCFLTYKSLEKQPSEEWLPAYIQWSGKETQEPSEDTPKKDLDEG